MTVSFNTYAPPLKFGMAISSEGPISHRKLENLVNTAINNINQLKNTSKSSLAETIAFNFRTMDEMAPGVSLDQTQMDKLLRTTNNLDPYMKKQIAKYIEDMSYEFTADMETRLSLFFYPTISTTESD